MAEEQKPRKSRRGADEQSQGPQRPRQKYPVIPVPQQRKSARPEIPRDPSERGRGWKIILVGGMWLVVLVLAAGAALRIFLHDWWIPLVWWNSFTFYVYLPAYLALVVALAMRRWRLATLATAVVACHLVWVVPDFLPRADVASADPAETGGTVTPTGPRLRLFYQNVNMHTDDFAWRIEQMLSADADVLALVEFSPSWEAAVQESRVPELYPHNTIRDGPLSQKICLFSRLPLEEVEYRAIGTGNLAIAATIELDGRPVRLFCIHAPRPLPVQARKFYAFGESVIEWVDKSTLPRVLVGDFNSTQHAAWYKALNAVADLHSAHRDVGRGYAVSWPNGRTWLPPIRIDHVLISPEFTCTSIREGGGGQSDHKPLICELVLVAGDNEGEDAVQSVARD